jgi:hypothetical protein
VRPTGTAEEQILGQYRRFWTETYPTVFSAPADERRALLSPVVGEPLLSELLRIASERDRAGKSTRGTPVLTEPVVSREGGLAVVSDCVDLTDVVLVDRSTGAVTEDGPDRKPTDTYLRRGSDAVWRVYSLNEPRGYRC